MEVSARFTAFLTHQLDQLSDRSDLHSLVVYLAMTRQGGKPGLVPVGHWPPSATALPPVEEDRSLQLPCPERRWLPLRREQLLLGAIRVETASLPWSPTLTPRLQATAQAVTEVLCLDLEEQRLTRQLKRNQEDLRLLVHQLRNPLAALRTFGKLLLRRLEGDPDNRSLVENLLAEEQQLNRYVEAIDGLIERPLIGPGSLDPQPLLLPPSLSSGQPQALAERLDPLLKRAAATASLQGRRWLGCEALPQWFGDSGAVAEIVANLLENAFRYCPPGAPIGLEVGHDPGDGERPRLIIWDGGAPIAAAERETIFERGRRGTQAAGLAGTGLGLTLARALARSMGGDLTLHIPPQALDAALPAMGNAFCLQLPASSAPAVGQLRPAPTPQP